AEWAGADFRRRLELVERFQDRIAELGGLRDHPFFGSRRDTMRPGDEARFKDRLAVARHSTATLREAASALASLLRAPGPEAPDSCAAAMRAAHALAAVGPRCAIAAEDWPARRTAARALVEAGERWSAIRAQFDAVLLPAAWDVPVDETRRVLN